MCTLAGNGRFWRARFIPFFWKKGDARSRKVKRRSPDKARCMRAGRFPTDINTITSSL